MDRNNSFIVNDIRNVLKQGGNVTHILNVKIIDQPNEEIGCEIRKTIFRRIANQQIIYQVCGIPNVNITWRTSAIHTSAYYHCDVNGILGDKLVKFHTEILLQNILNDIDNQFGHIFSSGRSGLSFLVTKPLSNSIADID